MPFNQDLRNKVLLWCDRHCCLCKKACGVNIEVHHIIPENEKGTDDIDNAIPLCFECHGIVHHYNTRQPIGTKYKPEELKARRDQIYEEYTRHLVPPIHYQVTQTLPNGKSREFPKVGFIIAHLGDSLPVKARTMVTIIVDDGPAINLGGHYSGEKLWNLNPRFTISAYFNIPKSGQEYKKQLKVRIAVSIIDQYEREHYHLPIEYVYVADGNYWYLEP